MKDLKWHHVISHVTHIKHEALQDKISEYSRIRTYTTRNLPPRLIPFPKRATKLERDIQFAFLMHSVML